jgi:hypothetical protein
LPTFTPGLTFAPAFTFELLTPTSAFTPTFGFTLSEFEVLLDELELEEPGVVDDSFVLSFMLLLRWVELEELLPGTVALPVPPEMMSVREDELAPGTTATPGVTSVVVLLVPPCAKGTLGMHPGGCVLAASMHFAWPDGSVTVKVSARATPKAASIEAARRVMVILRFMWPLPPS